MASRRRHVGQHGGVKVEEQDEEGREREGRRKRKRPSTDGVGTARDGVEGSLLPGVHSVRAYDIFVLSPVSLSLFLSFSLPLFLFSGGEGEAYDSRALRVAWRAHRRRRWLQAIDVAVWPLLNIAGGSQAEYEFFFFRLEKRLEGWQRQRGTNWFLTDGLGVPFWPGHKAVSDGPRCRWKQVLFLKQRQDGEEKSLRVKKTAT